MAESPLVTVVTPFFNTSAYLRECIESVLRQSYSNWHYLLIDNQSTDGSLEIAAEFAQRYPEKIRIIRTASFLTQVQNYNFGLSQIPTGSDFCKIVQADDYLFPDCLRLMVEEFRKSSRVGLVGAYDLKANHVRGSRFPYPASPMDGKQAARLCLSGDVFPFGSPTSVMYRSSIVRECSSFFTEGLFHEDSEKCMEILENWDFGFVYQVLSFIRTENESVSSGFRSYDPAAIDRYILVQRFADRFLNSSESMKLKREVRREYYDALAEAVLKRRGRAYWEHHAIGLKTLEQSLDGAYLTGRVFALGMSLALNPAASFKRLWNRKG